MIRRALTTLTLALGVGLAVVAAPVTATPGHQPTATAHATLLLSQADVSNRDDRYSVQVLKSNGVWVWIAPGGGSTGYDVKKFTVPVLFNITYTIKNTSTGGSYTRTVRGDSTPAVYLGYYDKVTVLDVYMR